MSTTSNLSQLAQLVLLSLWFGAALLLATNVAPSAFAVLPTRGLAGDLVGRVLPVIFWSGTLVGLASAALEMRSDPTSRARLVGSLAITAACVLSHLVFGGRIARIRAQLRGPIDTLAPDDPQRLLFGRLHALSVLGLALAMIACALVLFLAARAARR